MKLSNVAFIILFSVIYIFKPHSKHFNISIYKLHPYHIHIHTYSRKYINIKQLYKKITQIYKHMRTHARTHTTLQTRQSEMADLARRATRWVGTLSDGNVHVKFHDDRLRNGGDITY